MMSPHFDGVLFGLNLLLAATAYGVMTTPRSSLEELEQQIAQARPAQSQRVDLFDTRGNRTGYAIVDPRSGTTQTFDKDSNRMGSGRISPDGKTIELFDLNSNRTGTGRIK